MLLLPDLFCNLHDAAPLTYLANAKKTMYNLLRSLYQPLVRAMPRFTLLFAVCFGFLLAAVCLRVLFVTHSQAEQIPFGEKSIGKGHFGTVFSAAFSPDGKKIVTASYDYTARIWDVESGKELHTLLGHDGHSSGVHSAFFSPDGKKIVTTGSDGAARGLPDDDGNFGCVRIWNADTGKELKKLEGFFVSHFAVFSPDGKKIAAAGSQRIIDENTALFYARVLIWDVDSGKIVQQLEGHTQRVNTVDFSHDGKTILTSSRDGTARIWDTETGKELQKIEVNKGYDPFSPDGNRVSAAFFSPDGKTMMTAGAFSLTGSIEKDGTIRLWDISSGKELRKLEGHPKWNDSVAFSPDGKKIATTGPDGTARLWVVETGEELQKFGKETDWKRINFSAFSPDGKTIVTVEDDTMIIWDVETGKELKKWKWKIYYWVN